MDNSHVKHHEAMRQIDEIYAVIKGNLKGAISSTQMIVVGAMVACIPVVEAIFDNTIDPIVAQIAPSNAMYILFALRTAFYWGIFTFAGRFFAPRTKAAPNALVKQLFELGKLFPMIPVATAAMLALVGQSDLIAPLILIMIGMLFVIFGQFSSPVVSRIAWANIIAGLAGIYLSSLHINNLWAYLVVYQGLTFILMGILLNSAQKHD
jgi:hypothetical protein